MAIGLLLAAPIPALVSAIVLPRYAAVAVVGGIAVLLIAITLVRRFAAFSPRFADAAAAAGLAAVFEATCIAFGGDVRAVALLVAAVLLAVLAVRLRTVASLAASAVFGAAGLLLSFGGALRFDLIAVAPSAVVSRTDLVARGATGVLVAVAALTVAWAAGRVARHPTPPPPTPAGLSPVRSRSTVRRPRSLPAHSPSRPTSTGSSSATWPSRLSWTVGALVLLLRHVDSTPLRVAGLTLVGAALAKLVLFDLSSLSGIPRVLAFLGGGLVLLAAGARYAKLVSARTVDNPGS